MSVENAPPRRSRLIVAALPLAIFLALAGVFLMQLTSGRDGETIPSALIGVEAPKAVLPPVEGLGVPGLDPAAFIGKVTLLNVWASWCAPCREEHPVLLDLARDERFAMVGLNYKDDPQNAMRFLGGLGNPFSAVGSDPNGRAAIEWGVYGVPESFVIGRDGKILYKHVGPLSAESADALLMPEIEKALAAGQ